MNTIYFIVQPSFNLCFDVKVDSNIATTSRRYLKKIKIDRYTVACTANIILKSKQGLLSKSGKENSGSVF